MLINTWVDRVEDITARIDRGETVEEVGNVYGVSKQRIYQVMTKFGISTKVQKRDNFLRGKEPKYYWLNHMLTRKEVSRVDRLVLLETLVVPDYCPMLGCRLKYEGTGMSGWSRQDDAPSLDRIDSSIGYVSDNVQIISWRANRIKNDSTPEELMLIASYMQKLKK